MCVCISVYVCVVLMTLTHLPQRIKNILKLIFLNEGTYTPEITMPWVSTLIRKMDSVNVKKQKKKYKEKYNECTVSCKKGIKSLFERCLYLSYFSKM